MILDIIHALGTSGVLVIVFMLCATAIAIFGAMSRADRRSTTNQNARGNTEDRRRRRAWLLATFGDGVTCPCAFCGAELDETTITVDRIVPGVEGGRYVRGNIRPACAACNTSDGGRLGRSRQVA